MNTVFKKLLKSAGIATAGAVSAIILDPSLDWGSTAPWVVASLTWVARALLLVAGKGIERMAVMFLLVALPMVASGANLATEFSHGPTVPFFTVRFDDTGKSHGGMLNAGAGYSFNWNMAPTADGAVRRLTVGVPVFMRFDGVTATNFALAAGVTFGTFNNMLAIGAAADLVDVNGNDDGSNSGILTGKPSRADAMVLISFGLNLGGGVAPARNRMSLLGRAAADKPPPGYFKLR